MPESDANLPRDQVVIDPLLRALAFHHAIQRAQGHDAAPGSDLEFETVAAERQGEETLAGVQRGGLQGGHAQRKSQRLELCGLEHALQGREMVARDSHQCGMPFAT